MEPVIEKIKTWNFPELIDVFLQNEFDIEAFNNLNEENIKELIPKLGTRIKFLNKYRTYKKEILDEAMSDVSTDTITSVDETTDESIENIDKSVYLNKSCADSAALSSIFNPLSELCLKSVLGSTYQGRSLLLYYGKTKELGRSHRKQLVDLILNYICQLSSTRLTLTNKDFKNIAEKIVLDFPTEIVETYYIPPVRKVKSKIGKSEPAKGKLVDRYRNIKYKLQKSGVNDSESEIVESSYTFGEDVRESLDWLETRCDPWDEVLNHWKKTHSVRLACKSITAADFFAKWPLLQHSNGPTLIDVDFEIKYKKYVLTSHKLNYFFENVLSTRSKYVTDKQAIAYVELLKGNLSKDTKALIQLQLLSHLIPPRGRTRNEAKTIRKPTIAECSESIVIKVEVNNKLHYA